jgi:lactate dehydrogenase-like 2-hydroxyacid dehydrogenase
MKKKCLVLNNREPIPENFLADLESQLEVVWYQKTDDIFSITEALEQNKDTHILITTYMDLCQKNLELLPSLEAIIATTISTHFIDSGYCQSNNIKIFNTANYTGSSVAEHAVALMMGAVRKLTEINQAVRVGNTQGFEYPGMELFGKTAGIIGLGNIGSYVAQMLSGFGMDIVYFNRSQKSSQIAKPVDLDTLVTTSDIIFLTLALNNASNEMMNEQVFDNMKTSAILVNVSPDDVIDKTALVKALSQGKIAYAALDLLNPEPYLHVSNTILTCRRAWYTNECFDRRIKLWKNTLTAYLSNQLQQETLNHLDFVQVK